MPLGTDVAVVTGLNIYPIKACQGIEVQQAVVTPNGTLELDRQWCIVDLDGTRFTKLQSLSQRNLPALASLTVTLLNWQHEPSNRQSKAPTLQVEAPGMEPLQVR